MDEFLFLAKWTPVINFEVPILEAMLTLEVPQNYRINIKENNIGIHRKEILEGAIKYSWKTSYSELIPNELFSPSRYRFIPMVIVVPDNFKFGIEGSFKDWESYGNWQYRLSENTNLLPEAESNKIRMLVEGIESDREKICHANAEALFRL